MLMAVIPIVRDHKILGFATGDKEDKPDTTETLVLNEATGILTINTTIIGENINGYAAQTPVLIKVQDGRIKSIEALDNRETPHFLKTVLASGFLERLNGMTLSEAISTRIDGVTGATYTSNALIKNIQTGLNYAIYNNDSVVVCDADGHGEPGVKFYIILAFVLAASTLPFFFKNRIFRTIQLLLSVIILGFWGGTFLCFIQMLSALENGITQIVLVPIALMLVTAFIYPMFGRKNYYCNWICPYGALQELAGKCVKWKIKVSPKVATRLNYFRMALWFVLMWFLMTGLWYDWMDYEPFAAFMFTEASWVVIAIAGAFILLSLIVRRPYCRFVCPTGSLFKFAEVSN